MLKPIIENPLTPGHRVRNKKSRCIAQAMLSQDLILQLRDIDIPWSDIAMILKMSAGSLRKAMKQISAIKPVIEIQKPNALRPKLTLYFASEADKKYCIKWLRAVQNNEDWVNE